MARASWPRYPEFVPARLLERLAEWFRWPADGILAGNGSNELIQATLAVTVEPGDAVVAPAPTFSLYRVLTAVSGGRYVPVPLDDAFQYDMDRLIDVAVRERAKVVVLNSPNNPTGSVLPQGAVERVLAETGALVLCDEAYIDFGGADAMGALASSDRVVVLRTFSKALGMAGLRFGVGLAHPADGEGDREGQAAVQREPVHADGGGSGTGAHGRTPGPGVAHHRDARPDVPTAQRAARCHGVPERRQLLPGALPFGGTERGVPALARGA